MGLNVDLRGPLLILCAIVVVSFVLGSGCALPWDQVKPSPNQTVDADTEDLVDSDDPPDDADDPSDGDSDSCLGPACALVAHWPLDEVGPRAADVTENGNDCTIHDASLVDEGAIGSALRFDGDSAYLRCDESPSLDGISSRITVAAFVKRHQRQENYRTIVGRSINGTHQEQFILGFHDDEVVWIVLTETGTSPFATFDMSAVPLETWIHVAGTFDGSETVLYVGGLERDRQTQMGTLNDDTTALAIGAETNDGALSWVGHINASIDDVRIYDDVLEEAQIEALADAGSD